MAYTKKNASGAMPARSGTPKTGNTGATGTKPPKDVPANPGPKGGRRYGKAPIPEIPTRTGGDKTGPGGPAPETPGGKPTGSPNIPRTPGPKGMPEPVSPYGRLKAALHTPGMQSGEAAALKRIAANRGVSMKEAGAIGRRRTERGLPTARVKPGNGKPLTRGGKRIPGRTNPGPGPFHPKGDR